MSLEKYNRNPQQSGADKTAQMIDDHQRAASQQTSNSKTRPSTLEDLVMVIYAVGSSVLFILGMQLLGTKL